MRIHKRNLAAGQRLTLLLHSLSLGLIALWMLFGSSCANQGVGPGGGPRDSIPPVVVRSIPEPFQTNVSSNQIEVIFDEYVVPEKLNEKLVISPPLAQKPSIRTKGRGILVKINEDLIPDRTYSIDFKDGIKDYNEGNKIESFRMIFSTYNELDTLQVKGTLLDAFTLMPIENSVMSLYTIDNDSVFQTLRPDFIAKTDAEGLFLFDNLPQKSYKLYGLTDGDNNLIFNQPSEAISFVDSFIYVDAIYLTKIDTSYVSADSVRVANTEAELSSDTLNALTDTVITVSGFTRFTPEPFFCLQFTEKRVNRFLQSFKRQERSRMSLLFSEALCDSFQFSLPDFSDSLAWHYTEYSQKRDSVEIWIVDSLVAKSDTLLLALQYIKTGNDGISQMAFDTLKMVYSDVSAKKPKKNEEEEEMPETQHFSISTNLKGGDFDLDGKIIVEMPVPIDSISTESISF
jgi:hypothetical protein